MSGIFKSEAGPGGDLVRGAAIVVGHTAGDNLIVVGSACGQATDGNMVSIILDCLPSLIIGSVVQVAGAGTVVYVACLRGVGDPGYGKRIST